MTEELTDQPTTPADATDASPAKPAPTVRRVGEWHLVTANDFQVSIGPDALVMLPRHIHPRDIPDFIAAMTVAADVANGIYEGNVELGQGDDRSLAQRKALVTAGEPPPGSIRMRVEQRQSDQATIGRPNRRGRGARTSAPRTASPVRADEPELTRQQRRQKAMEQRKRDTSA